MFQRRNPSALQAQLATITKRGGGFEADATEWKLKQDKVGNGTAVIRFLPGKGDEGLPFVKLINHGFKMSGKWFIENCTSTHGDYDNCPVCQHMSANDVYNTNYELYKQIKRKTSYWSNILVVRDPANPENEGKVFKYRFGDKIMSKITAMIEVDPELGEDPIDVTCVFGGANFLLKVKKEGGFTNYDESKFQSVSEIKNINDPAFQKELADSMHDIMAIAKPDQFKPKEELETKFKQVMGTAAAGGKAAAAANAAASLDAQLDDFDNEMNNFEANSTPAASQPEPSAMSMDMGSGIDDDLDALLNDL